MSCRKKGQEKTETLKNDSNAHCREGVMELRKGVPHDWLAKAIQMAFPMGK